jgi:hypothetical protein
MLIFTFGVLKLALILLMYCRGFGQVPPSGPTICSVVVSFPPISDGVREMKDYYEGAVPLEVGVLDS